MSLFSIVQGRKAEQIPAPAPEGPPPAMSGPQGFPMPLPAMPPTGAPPMGGQPGGGLTVAGKPIGGFEFGGLQELPSYEYAPRPTEARQGDSDPNEFPPNMPAYEYADRPESDYPGTSIPGFEKGTIQFNAPPSDGSGTIPLDPRVFPTPSAPTPASADGSALDPQAARIIMGKATQYQLQGYTAEQAMAAAQADWELYNLDQQNALALRNTSTQGPDHFYEQQAEQIRQWEANRMDSQQLADATQRSNQQQAMADWRKTQVLAEQAKQQANQARQNNITSAAAQAQNFWGSLLSQADPNQAPLWVNASSIYEDAKNMNKAQDSQAASDANAPNIPGYVFDPNRGY